ncbi:MAG: hypothetical protein JNK57_14445, partial [Planctomycetaceae bacterium]|nr:hypothetical protein [Planctomycetaceae bacterium]
MKSTDLPANKQVRSGRGWLITVLLPPIGLLGVFLAWAGLEYREWLTIEAKIQARQTANQAITFEQFLESNYDRSNIDGILPWTTLVRQSDSMSHPLFHERQVSPQHLLVDFSLDFGLDKSVHSAWLQRSSASGDEYLSLMKPVFDRLDKVLTLPQPILTPNAGLSYGSMSAPGLYRLLNLDIMVSIVRRDRARILSGIERLQKLDQLMISNEIGWSCATEIYRQKNRFTLLSFCLHVPGWTAEQLAQLDHFATTETEWTSHWKADVDNWIINSLNSADSVHAMYYTYQSNKVIDQVFRPTPSWRADRLRAYEQLSTISFEDPFQAASEITRGSSKLRLVPQYNQLIGISKSLVEAEMLRRLVRCGIAIRRYKQTYGKWPKDLNELNQNPATMVNITLPVGYSIDYVTSEAGPEIRIFRTRGAVNAQTPELSSDLLTRWVVISIRDAEVETDAV